MSKLVRVLADIRKGGTGKLNKTISNPRRQLLRLIAITGFGRIENLQVSGGEPVLDPAPRIVRDIKLGGERRVDRSIVVDDLVSKPQVVDLLSLLSEMGDGIVEILEVQHGLPFRVRLEDNIAVEAL